MNATETKYYDGTKLLSMTDLNGKKPEIFICTSNRTAGKTTYFSRYFMNRFLKHGECFGLLYRYSYELDGVEEKFFREIGNLFFPTLEMKSVPKSRGLYRELVVNNTVCGYALAINTAEQLKKLSHVFSDVKRLLFDEFQSENNRYCSNELTKFISLRTSIARGKGEQTRYLPVIMLSNPVSLLNPYYVSFGISDRLQENTKFLRGNGFVLEQNFNESASQAFLSSSFNQAFSSEKYVAYAGQSIYLNDNKSFIEKMIGKSRYICTIKFQDRYYSINEFTSDGIMYCSEKVDQSFPTKIAVTTDDHSINYVMMNRYRFFIQPLRQLFDYGCFRFQNLKCKSAVMALLSL